MRGVLAIGVAIAVLAFAGCSDEPEPRFGDPTESPSASESTTSAAAEPEPWEEKSKAGAVAFARHWIDVFNEAMLSGSTKEMRAISGPGCKACEGYSDQIDDLYAKGGRLEGDGWVVDVSSVPPGPITSRAQVSLRITRTKQSVFTGKGAVRKYDATHATYLAELGWTEATWRMASLEVFK